MYVGMRTFWWASLQVPWPPSKKSGFSHVLISIFVNVLQIVFADEILHTVLEICTDNFMRHYLIYCSIYDSRKKYSFSSAVQFLLTVCKLLQTPLFYFSGNWKSNEVGLIWRFVTSFLRILCTDKINSWPFHHSQICMGSHLANSHSVMWLRCQDKLC